VVAAAAGRHPPSFVLSDLIRHPSMSIEFTSWIPALTAGMTGG
jgi:hypothetical protein